MPTKTPRNWRRLERHPLSAEYEDITGPAWEKFVADVKQHGVVNHRKVTLFEGKILDGWQLYRACKEAGKKPEFQHLPKGLTPERFVEIVNDNRRHESPEAAHRRVEKRRVAILDLHKEGKSTREIAQEIGVSQTQIRRDLEATEPGGSKETDEGEKPSREPGDDTEEIAEAKRKDRSRPKPGAALYDRAKFDEAFGALVREIDNLGRPYAAHNTPQAAGLRRLLGEYKTQFVAWMKDLKKSKKG